MTYYETRNGARVFAAGAFTLGGDQALRWTTGKLSSISGSGSRRPGTRSAPRPRAG